MGVCSVQIFKTILFYPGDTDRPYAVGYALAFTSAPFDSMVLFGVIFSTTARSRRRTKFLSICSRSRISHPITTIAKRAADHHSVFSKLVRYVEVPACRSQMKKHALSRA